MHKTSGIATYSYPRLNLVSINFYARCNRSTNWACLYEMYEGHLIETSLTGLADFIRVVVLINAKHLILNKANIGLPKS